MRRLPACVPGFRRRFFHGFDFALFAHDFEADFWYALREYEYEAQMLDALEETIPLESEETVAAIYDDCIQSWVITESLENEEEEEEEEED